MPLLNRGEGKALAQKMRNSPYSHQPLPPSADILQNMCFHAQGVFFHTGQQGGAGKAQ